MCLRGPEGGCLTAARGIRSLEPFYLEGQTGKLFAVYHAPSGDSAAPGILVAPPFAEELNRSRHMMAAAARALRAAGRAVLIVDLHGTGDSAGCFDDARWHGWHADLESGASWLENRGHPVSGVLAVRLGALLALDWLTRSGRALSTLVLWGAVTSGTQYLNQFLRLRVAESMARPDGGKETTGDLKARIAAGETVEIGGYGLTAPLTDAIEGLRAADLGPPPGCRAWWLDLAIDGSSALSPASQRVISAWRDAGRSVDTAVVTGPSFWTLQEPEHVPGLIDATVEALCGDDHGQ
ncbi:MAG: hydrolase 2, exosortase A system-associated [Alphaproteobacteria bacterium]|nr:MAG: hydrolase 2, exosortase A system-associated [Alphaproteobacteria bacterium]